MILGIQYHVSCIMYGVGGWGLGCSPQSSDEMKINRESRGSAGRLSLWRIIHHTYIQAARILDQGEQFDHTRKKLLLLNLA